MAREFWEMFLPENIIILHARWDGKNGEAAITFQYPDSPTIFVATFVRAKNYRNSEWHLEKIQ